MRIQPLWGWLRNVMHEVNPYGVGDWPEVRASAPMGLASQRVAWGQPLWGWQSVGCQDFSPFGAGLCLGAGSSAPLGLAVWRQPENQPLWGWPRNALRGVKPRKQLLCNSFRGLKRQTGFPSGHSTEGTVTGRKPLCGRLRRTDSLKNAFFLFVSFTWDSRRIPLARARANNSIK